MYHQSLLWGRSLCLQCIKRFRPAEWHWIPVWRSPVDSPTIRRRSPTDCQTPLALLRHSIETGPIPVQKITTKTNILSNFPLPTTYDGWGTPDQQGEMSVTKAKRAVAIQEKDCTRENVPGCAYDRPDCEARLWHARAVPGNRPSLNLEKKL